MTAADPGALTEAQIAESSGELYELLGRIVGIALPIDVGMSQVLLPGQ